MEIVTVSLHDLTILIERSAEKIISSLSNLNSNGHVSSERWFDLQELCDYLPDKPAKATIYAYVSEEKIPFHKGPKKLRFLKSEIDKWLNEGKGRGSTEIDLETDYFLSSYKKRGGTK